MNFLTPEQVAEILKVSPTIVLQWLQHKKLPGIKIGNVWRVEEGRLYDFLNSGLDASQSDSSDEYALYGEDFDDKRKFSSGSKRGRKPSGKYDGLNKYLKQAKGEQIKLSFTEIEEHMNDKLPQSAYRLRPWWGNDFTHSQARAWLHAGWQTRGVDIENRLITFARRT